ncbi:MAG: Na(+)/H(+) antiporter subunit B [Terriglobales bacterium]
MRLLQWIILFLITVTAPGVVLSRDPKEQVVSLSFYGLLFGLLFFIFQAPDVALSQITIGAVMLPLLIMLALTKMRRQNMRRERKGKK